jgi:hypothetical protein
MKIKLSSLPLQKTNGELLQADGTATGDYPDIGSGKCISRIYVRNMDAILNGERLGVETDLYIPFSAVEDCIPIKRTDHVYVPSLEREYEIVGFEEKIQSYIEDHWKLIVIEFNAEA